MKIFRTQREAFTKKNTTPEQHENLRSKTSKEEMKTFEGWFTTND